MQSTSTSALLFATAVRLSPPAHVKRWTGRAAPTIRLPDLASLRIAATPEATRPART